MAVWRRSRGPKREIDDYVVESPPQYLGRRPEKLVDWTPNLQDAEERTFKEPVMHPDTEKVLAELRKVPAFRGQEIAARENGVDVSLRISRELDSVEDMLQAMGSVWFQKHPGSDIVPYAVLLLYNPSTHMHDVSVQVGNAAILAMKQHAVAQLIGGELKREEDLRPRRRPVKDSPLA